MMGYLNTFSFSLTVLSQLVTVGIPAGFEGDSIRDVEEDPIGRKRGEMAGAEPVQVKSNSRISVTGSPS